MRRGYIVKKTGTETDHTEDNYSDGGASSSVYCRDVKYSNLNSTGYKKPKGGSRQDNFSRDEILERLENYIPLKRVE